jgi:high-affinity iron transporter
MIGAFYGLQKATFNTTEYIWEGTFSLVGCIVITILGAALLRVNKLREKWTAKITRVIEDRKAKKHHGHPLGHRMKVFTERYAMFLLPFVTVLREGLEAVVFIGGVGLSFPAAAFPLPVITGVLAGSTVGLIIYK